jgi:beta-glucosidase
VRDDVASVTRPVKELRGFQRVRLDPGQRRTLRFELDVQDLAFLDTAMVRVAEPGTFTVFAGSSSDAVREARFELRTVGDRPVRVPETCDAVR